MLTHPYYVLLTIDYIVELPACVYVVCISPFRFVTVQQRLTYFSPTAGPTLVSTCYISITSGGFRGGANAPPFCKCTPLLGASNVFLRT